jgi:hypothetical protein
MPSRPSKTAVWPSPVKGLLRNGALIGSPPDGAEVLDNFICTAEGARIRGGASFYARTGAAITRLMTYRSGAVEVMFAATQDAVYDVSAVAQTTTLPDAEFDEQLSGDWSNTQFATAGGQFLFIVNGADPAQYFDGSTWTVPTINNVDSEDLNFVWSHKRRLWFCENDRLSAWYLDINSIAGDATEFPLDGIFRLGGRLMFGGTWSLDSGDGLDDTIVFVTTEGEIAVYQGIDPDTDFTLTGVYRVGRPLNKNAWFRAGGDLAIVTEDGIVSIGSALQMDRAALQTSAITSPIEDLWREAIAGRSVESRFPLAVWPTQTLFMIGVPSTTAEFVAFCANTRTGAWSRIVGWDAQAFAVFQDRLYFGNSNGFVLRADFGGQDFVALSDGVFEEGVFVEGVFDPGTLPIGSIGYTGVYVPKFQEFGSPGDKFALHARATWRTDGQDAVRLSCFQNYAIGQYPAPQIVAGGGSGKWGSGIKWGTGSKWGATATKIAGTDWQSVSGAGFSLSPAMVVGSNKLSTPKFEIVSVHLRYEEGRAL